MSLLPDWLHLMACSARRPAGPVAQHAVVVAVGQMCREEVEGPRDC